MDVHEDDGESVRAEQPGPTPSCIATSGAGAAAPAGRFVDLASMFGEDGVGHCDWTQHFVRAAAVSAQADDSRQLSAGTEQVPFA